MAAVPPPSYPEAYKLSYVTTKDLSTALLDNSTDGSEVEHNII